ncbi:MAG: hypothetical protein HGA78_06575 [Nitrospirales bacterium]|nr:hypothetical protein [Nitrospirales bacterium]
MTQRTMTMKSFMVPLIVLVFLVSASWLPAAQKAPVIERGMFGWQISNARIISPGTTNRTEEGSLTTDYIVEATAVAKGSGAPVQTGTFRATMSVFSPNHDMTGQKAGLWYLTGKWTISDAKADKKTLRIRHNRSVAKGMIKTSLSFNPVEQKGSFDAYANILMSPAGGRWTSAEGLFSGNERIEGQLLLIGGKWPDLSMQAGR